MSDHDPGLVEKATKAVAGLTWFSPNVNAKIARAVLDAVAPDLRREGWERGWLDHHDQNGKAHP